MKHAVVFTAMLGITMLAGPATQTRTLSGAEPSPAVVRVAQSAGAEFRGSDERPILAAMKKLGAAGGTVRIGPGQYLMRRGLKLPGNVTLKGTRQTVLKLASPVLVTAPARQGQDFLAVDDTSELAADTSIEVLPPAGSKTFPGTDTSSHWVEIRHVEPGKLVLAAQLPHAVPERSRVGYRSNLLFIGGSAKNVTVEGLVLDGGRKKDIPMPGHCSRCALLAHGIWSYQEGPTAPPIENVRVADCHVRNCYGRAVAMYSVVRSEVKGCLVEDIDDEGIDLDHFCYHCQVTGNTVRRSHTGVTINDGSYCTIQGNRVEDCGVGVTMWWWHHCPQKNLNVENVIRDNVITGPKRVGISLGKKCLRNQIVGNVVQGGIKVAEPDNLVEKNVEK